MSAKFNAPFNAPDALQAGVAHLVANAVPFFKRHGVALLAAAAAISALQAAGAGANLDMFFASVTGRNVSVFDWITLSVVLILNIGLFFAVLTYLFAGAASQAAQKGEDDYVWKLGSAEPPLLGVTRAQNIMARSTLRRIVSLWPGLIFALAWAIKTGLDFQLKLFLGSPPDGMEFGRNVAWLVSVVFLVWFVGRIAQNFLFRAAVIVDTGAADKAEIAARMPGFFPRYLTGGAYWNCAALIVACMLPVWVTGWLIAQVHQPLSLSEITFVPQLITNTVRFAAWALAAIFLAGAVYHALQAGKSPDPERQNARDAGPGTAGGA